jgi:hypothetical protein
VSVASPNVARALSFLHSLSHTHRLLTTTPGWQHGRLGRPRSQSADARR